MGRRKPLQDKASGSAPWRFVIDRVFHPSQAPLRDPPDRSASSGKSAGGVGMGEAGGRDKTPNTLPFGIERSASRPGSRLESCRAPPASPLPSGPRGPGWKEAGGGFGGQPGKGRTGWGATELQIRPPTASMQGANHRRVVVDSPPRLGNKRIGSDSGSNRNVPPGVLSRWPKNPQATRTIRWSLVAGVLEFCRATRDSLLESCRANY